MPKPVELTDAEKAKRILHEDRVSPNVERANKRLSEKLWVLFHADSYALGVLQLLESMRLLRDPEAEREFEERRLATKRALGEPRTDRETAYRTLVLQVAAWSNIPGAVERLHMIDEARDDDEYRKLTRRFESDELPRLVEEWREKRQMSVEGALDRVAALLDPKRKTLPMQALRDALGLPTETEN